MDRLRVVGMALFLAFVLHLVSPVVSVLTGGVPGGWMAFAQSNENADESEDDSDESEDDTDDADDDN